MNKVVRPEDFAKKSTDSKNSKKRSKRRSGIFLLEPRVMYDGAGVHASASHHGDHHHDHAGRFSRRRASRRHAPKLPQLVARAQRACEPQ